MITNQSVLLATMIYAKITYSVSWSARGLYLGLCYTLPVGPLRRNLVHYKRISSNLEELAELLELPIGDLPRMGGPVGSPDFLLLLARTILSERPVTVVEFGSGVSSFVIARCLEMIGTGRLLSFDHNESFAEIARRKLARRGLSATIRAVPLRSVEDAGLWYDVDDLPHAIDMIVIDGPPSSLHPETRSGAGPATFAKLSEGGTVFLDDAYRPGERRIAARWQQDYPEIRFAHVDTIKGTLVGRKQMVPSRLSGMPARRSSVALEGLSKAPRLSSGVRQ